MSAFTARTRPRSCSTRTSSPAAIRPLSPQPTAATRTDMRYDRADRVLHVTPSLHVQFTRGRGSWRYWIADVTTRRHAYNSGFFATLAAARYDAEQRLRYLK